MPELRLSLPLPPSVNHERFSSHHRTPAARKWRSAAWVLATDQKNRARWVTPPAGAICLVSLFWHWPDGRKRDCDNRHKPLFDLLTAAHVWQDDQWAVVKDERFDLRPKKGGVDVIVDAGVVGR